MTQPKPKSYDMAVRKFHQPFWLLAIAIIALGVDKYLHIEGLALGVSMGAGLNYVMHWLFIWISYRKTQLGRAMIQQMGLALLLKWLTALIGFALIFAILPVVPPFAVLLGFIIMQLAIMVNLWRLGRSISNK